jgi:hypothetical protein
MAPRSLSSAADIEQALRRVGELVAAAGESHAIVIVGGAALTLLGVVARATRDVDILAFARARGRDAWTLVPPPTPLPEALAAAIRTVGRDMGLADDWLNTGPALQWKQGLPPGLATRVQWRQYAALHVGLVGRKDLIWLKLYAAADDRPEGRHARDLVALAPSDDDLEEAAQWVKTQDAGAAFPGLVEDVVNYVRASRSPRHG